jgi:hypothetical protein
MRQLPPCLITLVTMVTATSLAGQAPAPAPDVKPRAATITLGIGNSNGWFGLRGEKYFSGDRLSLTAGLGYTPASDGYEAAGVTGSVGARGYTGGRRHRGFAELSITQVQVETRFTELGEGYWSGRYGPGIQLGYQLVTGGGLTFEVSGGLGYAMGSHWPGEGRQAALIGLAFGYTFR